jgi:FMN phosphatase YigB (HAD superfamily)
MQVINKENVIFFDVDDTLVLWDEKHRAQGTFLVRITDPYDNKTVWLTPHQPHIKLLKNHFARGTVIVVWSQGGFAWAEAVVKALGLEDYVHFVMSKPRAYVDDLPTTSWMTERIFIKPDSKWGTNTLPGDRNEAD